jgi:hypothetical protein
MKTPLNFTRTAIVMAALVLSALSCKKDSSSSSTSADEQATITQASAATSSESLYDDAFDVVTQSSEQSSISTSATVPVQGVSNRLTSSTYAAVACAMVTLSPADPSVFPKTMTIDYGTGCTSSNGITRKGKLIVNLTGPMRSAGSVISVTFSSYSVNGYTLTGTYSLTPQLVAGGGVNFAIAVTNGSITVPSGAVYTYSGAETFTQVGGVGTTTVTDDTYNITGSFSYNGNGTSISGAIVTPLVRTADCPNITTGTISFTYKSITGLLDFGSGTCDNTATVKAGLTTTTITLPR